MKPFVNFNKRSINLPPGCKDLADLLRPPSKPHGPITFDGVPWVSLPKPEHVTTKALADIEPYVERLVISESRGATLMVTDSGLGIFAALYRFGTSRELVFSVSLDQSDKADCVLCLRAFFERRGILPHLDYSFATGEAKSKWGCFAYALPADPKGASRLVADFFRDVYQLPEQCALDLSYCEDLAPPSPPQT
jgi:hypothetical protein